MNASERVAAIKEAHKKIAKINKRMNRLQDECDAIKNDLQDLETKGWVAKITTYSNYDCFGMEPEEENQEFILKGYHATEDEALDHGQKWVLRMFPEIVLIPTDTGKGWGIKMEGVFALDVVLPVVKAERMFWRYRDWLDFSSDVNNLLPQDIDDYVINERDFPYPGGFLKALEESIKSADLAASKAIARSIKHER